MSRRGPAHLQWAAGNQSYQNSADDAGDQTDFRWNTAGLGNSQAQR